MSLDLQVGQEQDTELSQMILDDSPTPEDYATQGLMRQDVEKMLAELKSKERQVISLRFGLFDGTEWTLRAIGKKLNLSSERVRQLEGQAMTHLKRKKPKALRDYLVS